MLQRITYEHDEKASWAQSLVHTYSEHVDTNSKLMQTALNAMEEPEMAAFLQVLQAYIWGFLLFCEMSTIFQFALLLFKSSMFLAFL